VEELTQYCKKLSNGEDLDELDNVSSDGNDSEHDREGNSRAFNHPFMVKDRGPIVMNIRVGHTLFRVEKVDFT
jgi:protein SON